ncbi:MAG TPA: hypothetical protein VGH77_01355 [Streptosporangiaceae bacterium]|jgi:hypothetical protein
MDLIRLLIALHPRDWRERYGAEFAALLEDTRLTPAAIGDVVIRSAGLRLWAHQGALLLATAVVISAACETVAKQTGLAVNILWLPTDPVHALVLLGAVGPWAALLIRTAVRRRSAGRG